MKWTRRDRKWKRKFEGKGFLCNTKNSKSADIFAFSTFSVFETTCSATKLYPINEIQSIIGSIKQVKTLNKYLSEYSMLVLMNQCLPCLMSFLVMLLKRQPGNVSDDRSIDLLLHPLDVGLDNGADQR